MLNKDYPEIVNDVLDNKEKTTTEQGMKDTVYDRSKNYRLVFSAQIPDWHDRLHHL